MEGMFLKKTQGGVVMTLKTLGVYARISDEGFQ